MKNITFLLNMLIIFFFISCESNSRETDILVRNYKNPTETPEMVPYSAEEIIYKTNKAVINADCYYYQNYENEPAGRLVQGQEIFIGEHYYLSGRFDIDVEVKTVDGTINGYVSERYITRLDGSIHDLWFKNLLLTREYYYTESVEYIFNNDYGKDIRPGGVERKRVIGLWRTYYSENRLYFFDNYIAFGIDEDGNVYRIESVSKNGNVYSLKLSKYSGGEVEIVLVDEGNSITVTKCVVKKELSTVNDILNLLNYRYVPQDKEKSEKTKVAVLSWCDEQLEILTQN